MFASYAIYYFLNYDNINDLKKSDINIQNQIKQTIHELNTPVSTIKLNTKILLKDINSNKNIQRLEKINLSCDKLLKSYDYMQYNIQKNINDINYEKFNLKDIVDISINNFIENECDINIHNNINSKIYINTDKYGFVTIINNLISNSIKYNKNNNDININFNNNILQVIDNGIGIDIKNISQIYDSYYQENPNAKGHGLGLSIVKSFCDNNNIKLDINSITNKKTCVKLDLNKIIINN